MVLRKPWWWSGCPSHAPCHRREISKPAVPVNSFFVLNNLIAAVDGKHFIPASSGQSTQKILPAKNTFQKVKIGLYKSSIIFSQLELLIHTKGNQFYQKY